VAAISCFRRPIWINPSNVQTKNSQGRPCPVPSCRRYVIPVPEQTARQRAPRATLASSRLRSERLKPINVVQVAAKLTNVSAPMRRRMYFLGETSRRRLWTA
jgi:uncharacterized protein (DUF3084 family)